MLGGHITAKIIKAQSSKDNPETCVMVHGVQ